MLSMNVQDVLKAMGKTDVEVEHTDFSSAAGMNADYIVCGKDIAEAMRDQSKVIALDSILSKQELREKLEAIF